MLRRSMSAAVLSCLALALAGCPNPATQTSLGAREAATSTSAGGLTSNNAGAMTSSDAAKAAMPTAPASASPSAAPAAVPPGEAASAIAPGNQQQTILKAGSVDDNADFAGFQKYLAGYQGQAMRRFDVDQRAVLKVLDADGHAVSNAEVSVVAEGGATDAAALMTGKTYADGRSLFPPKAAGATQATSFKVTAKKADSVVTKTFKLGEAGPWELKLEAAFAKPAPKLDVLFMLDATGSMGGEIRQLQSTIQTISDRIKALEGQPKVRFGLVSYRDQGDAYVTRKTDFTDDLSAFQRALNDVEAGGGGDIPEDLETALAVGVNSMNWDEGETIRLVFVVADAEPHIDYPQGVPYTTSMQKAAGKGVKLYMVGTSGLTAGGEYAFRQIAQATLAKYLFVTRGGDETSGGGGAASATVGQYAEGRLDDLVVDIVKSEVGALGK